MVVAVDKVGGIDERLDDENGIEEKSVKVDIEEESCAWSSMGDAESSLKPANVTEEAGDGTPYDLCSPLRDLVGVNFSAGELSSVTEEDVDAGVSSPDSILSPRSSREISDFSVSSVKVEVAEPEVEGADDAHIALRALEAEG